jgi:hypothetical protein
VSGEHFNFSTDWQNTLLACLMRQPDVFEDVVAELKWEFFTGEHSQIVSKALLSYFKEHATFPSLTVLGNMVGKLSNKEEGLAFELVRFIQNLSELDTADAPAYP